MLHFAEYIWLDGAQPTQRLRSKTRILDLAEGPIDLIELPVWSFDGSSTYQSDGGDSDLLLQPATVVSDPLRANGLLVLCEVLNADGSPHESNQRARLRDVLEDGAAKEDPWFGFEQEYTLLQNGRPLGFPASGFPEPQGPYYCGVGAQEVFGRDLVEAHARACIDAGLMIYGTNAEVMPGQWEFQIGYRGISAESADPLNVSDHLWIARWLLHRMAEERGIIASFDPKPVEGDWNGAGAHTNFSTRATRGKNGLRAIDDAIARLAANHDDHIAAYGAGLDQRLTGLHETCSIDTFKSGVADRGSSIRIPRNVAADGAGYLEDRRPGANCDPYVVSERILRTVCIDESQQRRFRSAI
jgi:glutamine synthetase